MSLLPLLLNYDRPEYLKILLPYNRIIAFYGNLYSKRMGILGEVPKKEMLKAHEHLMDNTKRSNHKEFDKP